MEMNYNFHTHTYRSHHASGTPEEYVLRAIENGIKYMGFSDHVPIMFEDGKQSWHRVLIEEAADYFREIKSLAEKYKDKIEIHVGFEAEYYEKYFKQMLSSIVELGAEYLIVGQHFLGPENEGFHFSFNSTESDYLLKKYVNMVIGAMSEGVFTYVAHPDMFYFVGDIEDYNREMTRLCKASKLYKVPLEINFLGIRGNRPYPTEKFWSIAGKIGCPVTFGFDAHDVLGAYDGDSFAYAMELVEKYNLNYIGKPKLVPIKRK